MGSRPVEGYHNVANSTLWYCILQDPEIYFQKKKKKTVVITDIAAYFIKDCD